MKEIRFFKTEVRAEMIPQGEASVPALTGYAVKWMQLSQPIYTRHGVAFRERVKQGAFDKAMRSQEQYCFVEHDPSKPLGRTSARSLELACDATGLHARCFPDLSVSYARDLYQNVKNGTIRSMSFAFSMPADGSGEDWEDWDDDEDERCTRLRTLRSAETLSEVSYVLKPAYTSSEANARSLFPQGIPTSVEKRSSGVYVISADTERVRAAILKSNSLL